MSIFLIRHGETALNAARVLQPADTPLSERGTAQARALAERLRGIGVARVLSSDLPRARRTADAIAAATGAPVRTTPLLQERHFGSLRGRAYDSLGHDPIASRAAPPGGESMEVFESRVEAAWQCITAAALATGDGHLAVVSHGLVIRLLLDRIERGHRRGGDGPTAEPSAPAHLGNTSLSIIDRAGSRHSGDDDVAKAEPRFVARLVNCTAHLASGAGDDGLALSGG